MMFWKWGIYKCIHGPFYGLMVMCIDQSQFSWSCRRVRPGWKFSWRTLHQESTPLLSTAASGSWWMDRGPPHPLSSTCTPTWPHWNWSQMFLEDIKTQWNTIIINVNSNTHTHEHSYKKTTYHCIMWSLLFLEVLKLYTYYKVLWKLSGHHKLNCWPHDILLK